MCQQEMQNYQHNLKNIFKKLNRTSVCEKNTIFEIRKLIPRYTNRLKTAAKRIHEPDDR